MCLAKATLVYGLTIRSSDLVFAAHAFARLRQTLPFFDLVSLRRRAGTFVSSSRGGGYSAVTKIPNDVWEWIKYCLISEETAESEDALIGPLLCGDPSCQVRPPPSHRMTLERLVEIRENHKECRGCMEAYVHFGTSHFKEWDEPVLSTIVELLSAFGLALPSHNSIVTSELWLEPWYGPLALVATPSYFSRGKDEEGLIKASPEGERDQAGHTIVDVSTANLPSDVDQRFERLIKLFDLEVVDSSINKISPRFGKSMGKRSKKEAPTCGAKNEITSKIKPSWKVYLLCKTGW